MASFDQPLRDPSMLRLNQRTSVIYFHNHKHVAIDFEPIDRFSDNGMKPIKPTFVRAVNRAEHGDWKTQSSRREFMGLEKGAVAQLLGVWTNFEGQQLRLLRLDGKELDAQARDLEIIDEATYRYTETLHSTKFHYETDHADIPHFDYHKEIAVGHTMQVMNQSGESIRIRVVGVEHVMGLVGGTLRSLFIRLSMEWIE